MILHLNLQVFSEYLACMQTNTLVLPTEITKDYRVYRL